MCFCKQILAKAEHMHSFKGVYPWNLIGHPSHATPLFLPWLQPHCGVGVNIFRRIVVLLLVDLVHWFDMLGLQLKRSELIGSARITLYPKMKQQRTAYSCCSV